MAQFRIHGGTGFTSIDNEMLRMQDLSLKAKGLLCVMLSLPPEWNYSVNGLVAICKENATAITTALKELKDAGYVHVTKLFPNKTGNGRIEYIYDVYATRSQNPYLQGIEKQALEKQDLENQGLEFQGVENMGLYKIKNTKERILKKEEVKKEDANVLANVDTLNKTLTIGDYTTEEPKKKEQKHKYGEYNNVLLTDKELSTLQEEYPNDWEDRIERLSGYLEQSGKKYKSHYATIRNWARRDKKQSVEIIPEKYRLEEKDYNAGWGKYE